jgi:hypothetical protein
MAESSLSVSFDDLKAAIGHYLGYGGADDWTADQDAEIETYVQAGVRQFYYPPAVEGVEAGYTWSFLAPKTTIATTADQGEDDAPDDFGRLLGPMHHEPDVYAGPVQILSRPQIRRLKSRSDTDDTGTPIYVAVREKASDGSTGQRKELVWWPVPDDAYTITYQYEAYQGILDDDYPYPLGGMKHSDLVVTSCLAVAEQRANDERGIHWEAFIRQLASSIAQDRKGGAQYFGPMCGPDSSPLPAARELRQGDVTYNSETW